MILTRRRAMALALGAVPFAGLAPARAAGTEVAVSLWDRGPQVMQMLNGLTGMGYGMHRGAMMGGQGMMAGNGRGQGPMGNGMGPMGIDARPDGVPAGEVTFRVRNDSSSIIHEMIVAPVPADGADLPFDAAQDAVDEEAAHSLGEVSELDPGGAGALTVTLQPGRYILYCNVPGHYRLGMWTTIAVTG